jgi:hypothetical protein
VTGKLRFTVFAMVSPELDTRGLEPVRNKPYPVKHRTTVPALGSIKMNNAAKVQVNWSAIAYIEVDADGMMRVVFKGNVPLVDRITYLMELREVCKTQMWEEGKALHAREMKNHTA